MTIAISLYGNGMLTTQKIYVTGENPNGTQLLFKNKSNFKNSRSKKSALKSFFKSLKRNYSIITQKVTIIQKTRCQN